jgi:hypothetical protein
MDKFANINNNLSLNITMVEPKSTYDSYLGKYDSFSTKMIHQNFPSPIAFFSHFSCKTLRLGKSKTGKQFSLDLECISSRMGPLGFINSLIYLTNKRPRSTNCALNRTLDSGTRFIYIEFV